jgi:DNA-binding MarR family transcriptional regulator
VRRADRALNRLYDEALRPSGLLTTQYALLSRLARVTGPMSHHQLAEAMAMAGTTLSRNLTPLVRDGLVHIEPGNDRRTRFVSITPKGQAVSERARPLWQSVQEGLVAEAGEARIAMLIGELSELVARVQR